MKVQQIDNYMNKYSANKNQQMSAKNLNFGRIDVVDLSEGSTTRRFGAWLRKVGVTLDNAMNLNLHEVPQKARRIIGFENAKPEEIAPIGAHFDTLTQHLSAEVRKDLRLLVKRRADGVVNVGVSDGNLNRFGHGQVSDMPPIEAAKVAVTKAVRQYLESASADRLSGNGRRGALAQTAREQDVVGRFTEGSF